MDQLGFHHFLHDCVCHIDGFVFLFFNYHILMLIAQEGKRAKHLEEGEHEKPFQVGPVDSGIWPSTPLPVGKTARSRASAQMVPSTPVTPGQDRDAQK